MKLKEIFLWNLLWGAIYFATNNIAISVPYKLPLLPFENTMDMTEIWMMPYLSWFAYNIVFCRLIKTGRKEFTRLMTGLVLLHGLIFLFFPTAYPRNYDFEALTPLSQAILSCDRPQNCFPSLHVAFVFMTLLLSRFVGLTKKARCVFIIWGTFIMASTVFVKQHYVLDVAGGIAISTIYLFFYLRVMTPLGKSNNKLRR